MAQYPNQPPYGQPPQGQGQPPMPPGQPLYGQPQPQQPQYGGQPQPNQYQPQYPAQQPQYGGQPQPQYVQPQAQYGQPQPQVMNNPLAGLNAPAPSVPFSGQSAVGVFLAYIFLVLLGPVPILSLYNYGLYSGANFHFEGLIPLAGALVVFLLEKSNSFVRFHAAQALVFSIAWIILEFILGLLESVSALTTLIAYLNQILFVGYGFIIAYLIYRAAYKSELYKLPIVGNLAQSLAGGQAVTR